MIIVAGIIFHPVITSLQPGGVFSFGVAPKFFVFAAPYLDLTAKILPVTIVTRLFNRFFNSEKSSGIILFCCTVFSLTLTNSGFESYVGFWETSIAGHSLAHWINDGLMTIFFLMVGLELEREIYIGELSDVRNALLPLFAALGGMLAPAGIYLMINWNGETAGAGIPMATDIAFALAALSMLGKRVPVSLKVFLTALAVIDDLGAILVISIFYSESLNLQAFGIAMGIFAFLLVLNRLKVHNLIPYLAGGAVMWYFMLSSGIHATITGVLVAFAIPFGNGDEKSPSYGLQDFLHAPVAFVILPIFALANTCILIDGDAMSAMGGTVTLGIMAGLFFGKPLGVFAFSYLTTLLKLAKLPGDIRWAHIIGAGILAGIGFTMSIFITLLAFDDHAMVDSSKLSVMIASLVAGVAGFIWLRVVLGKDAQTTKLQEEQ